MSNSVPRPQGNIKKLLSDFKLTGKKVVIPSKARLTSEMSQEILGALEPKPFESDVRAERIVKLRKNAKNVAPALGQAFHSMQFEQFHERFALVSLMNEIDDAATLPELVSIVEAPVEKFAAHSQNRLIEKQRDTMMRTLAQEGVSQLARKGNSSARSVLENQLHHPSFSVRRGAVQALLALGGSDAREKIRSVLPEKDHFLLDIKVRDPRDILRSVHLTMPKTEGHSEDMLPIPKTNRAPGRISNRTNLYPRDLPLKTINKGDINHSSEQSISLSVADLLGDNYILGVWLSNPDFLERANWLADRYGIKEAHDTWENAGYNDCTNLDLPMARVFTGLFLLTHASDDEQTYLVEARKNAINLLDDTRWVPTPSNAFAVATTRNHSFVELHNAFLDMSVVERAATFWHEAVHVNGDSHDAFFPSWSELYQQDLDNGQADEYFGTGAYSHSVAYLFDYIAHATLATSLLRTLARHRANFELDNCFAKHPGFIVGMPLPLPGDFDSNLYTDYSVYRPSDGSFYIQPINAVSTGTLGVAWGQAGDIPVTGCYKKMGVMDYAVYRPSDGYWHIMSGINHTTESVQWGQAGDIPVPADYNGDGLTDIAVWRPSAGYLYNGDGSSIKLGRVGDIPVPGYFYIPLSDIPRAYFAVFRPSSGEWLIWNHYTNRQVIIKWGQAGDIPVPGDYDGDGIDELAVWRPSDGMWHIYNLAKKSSWSVQLGAAGDIPVPGYYYVSDDKRLQAAVWRPSDGNWYVNDWDTHGMYTSHWGQAGDIPIPGVTGWLFYRRLMQDIDGDRRTEIGVFRPSAQEWYSYNLAKGKSQPNRSWPIESDEIIVPADYDGDGCMEYATWRPRDGVWRWYDKSLGREKTKQWGQIGDIPVPADYDGDSCAELAVWRPGSGEWHIMNILSGQTRSKKWGQAGDIPAPADFDGDGRVDFAVWRGEKEAKFHILQSMNDVSYTIEIGKTGDIPVPADYDGDGHAEAAIWRPSDGIWRIKNVLDGATKRQQWGQEGDIPIPGDYDGDGRIDIAVWRPSDGNWHIVNSASGKIQTIQFGMKGDIPITATADDKARMALFAVLNQHTLAGLTLGRPETSDLLSIYLGMKKKN